MQRFATNPSFLLRYGFALLSVAVAVAVMHAFDPIVGRSAAPFAVITATVTLSAWLAGTGPAAVAATLGLAAVDWYFVKPLDGSQNYINIIHLTTYLLVAGSVLLMSAAYRRGSSRFSAEPRCREASESRLPQEQDALREAEEKFRAIAETGSSAIFIHDGSRLRYMN